MEEVVAIHANDITGRPLSVQPCNMDLEESGIGCDPVSIGTSAGAADGAAAVSGTPENVLHLSYVGKVRTYHTKPYAAYVRQLAIPVWRFRYDEYNHAKS